jgi:hypothetical protein
MQTAANKEQQFQFKNQVQLEDVSDRIGRKYEKQRRKKTIKVKLLPPWPS